MASEPAGIITLRFRSPRRNPGPAPVLPSRTNLPRPLGVLDAIPLSGSPAAPHTFPA